jgi:hypothetical protein
LSSATYGNYRGVVEADAPSGDTGIVFATAVAGAAVE